MMYTDSPTSLVLLVNNFPPEIDGVGDYVRCLSAEAMRQGVSVEILCRDKEAIHLLAEEKGWTNVHPILTGWSKKDLGLVVEFMEKRPGALLNLHYVPFTFQKKGLPFQMLWFGMKLAGMQLPFYVTFHEVSVRMSLDKPQRIPLALGQRFIANCLALMSRKSFTSIGLYHQYFWPFLRQKVERIPIGSNIPLIPQTSQYRSQLRSQFADEDSCLLSFFGRNPRKIELALGMLQELDTLSVSASLLLIGDFSAEWQVKLKEKATSMGLADRVHLTGYLPADEIYAHLSAADIYLGMFESGICLKSGTIAAALGAGLAIVGTQGDMTDPFFKTGQNCLLVKNLEVAEFAKAIASLWVNPSSLERIGKGAKASFQEELSWEITWQKYAKTMSTWSASPALTTISEPGS